MGAGRRGRGPDCGPAIACWTPAAATVWPRDPRGVFPGGQVDAVGLSGCLPRDGRESAVSAASATAERTRPTDRGRETRLRSGFVLVRGVVPCRPGRRNPAPGAVAAARRQVSRADLGARRGRAPVRRRRPRAGHCRSVRTRSFPAAKSRCARGKRGWSRPLAAGNRRDRPGSALRDAGDPARRCVGVGFRARLGNLGPALRSRRKRRVQNSAAILDLPAGAGNDRFLPTVLIGHGSRIGKPVPPGEIAGKNPYRAESDFSV